MVKFLLLALACSLACAEDGISGDWLSVALASSNVDKISPEGPFRIYHRHLQCLHDCRVMAITFYVQKEECQKVTLFAKQEENGVYRVYYEGDNHFKVVKQTEDFVVIYNENLDNSKQLSKMVFVLGKGESLDADQQEELASYAETKGIPVANIEYVLDTDLCPK